MFALGAPRAAACRSTDAPSRPRVSRRDTRRGDAQGCGSEYAQRRARRVSGLARALHPEARASRRSGAGASCRVINRSSNQPDVERGILARDGDESARRVLAGLLVCVVTKATQSARSYASRITELPSASSTAGSLSIARALLAGRPARRARYTHQNGCVDHAQATMPVALRPCSSGSPLASDTESDTESCQDI